MFSRQIRLRQVADQRVLTMTAEVKVGQIEDHIDASAERLAALAKGVGPLFVVYHGEVTTEVANPVEVCLPVAVDDPFSGAEGVCDRIEQAHHQAFRGVTKGELDYPEILDVYAELDAYLRDNGWVCSASPRELYLRDFATATMEDEVCQVIFPFSP